MVSGPRWNWAHSGGGLGMLVRSIASGSPVFGAKRVFVYRRERVLVVDRVVTHRLRRQTATTGRNRFEEQIARFPVKETRVTLKPLTAPSSRAKHRLAKDRVFGAAGGWLNKGLAYRFIDMRVRRCRGTGWQSGTSCSAASAKRRKSRCGSVTDAAVSRSITALSSSARKYPCLRYTRERAMNSSGETSGGN